MIIQILLLIVGFVVLIKGADIFVDGASSTALNFKISKIIIGLTIVAFGTSAPEFAISIKALLSNSGEIVLGNVVGSNISNSLLILGIASVICPLTIKTNTIKKELPLSLLISTLLVILFLDNPFNGYQNQITKSDGIVMILFFIIFVYYLFSTIRNKTNDEVSLPKYSLSKSIIFIILGIIGVIVGSELVVNSATSISKILGISDRLISLTVITFGTSLPELVTTITAARKKEQDILIGNIIGSNIFNICVVLGIPVALIGGISPSSFLIMDLLMLLVSSIMLFVFARSNHKISKSEGIIMLSLYFIYYAYIIIIDLI